MGMAMVELHSTAELRRVNRNRVYRYIYGATEPVTKQDLAWALSMSLPTLTQNLTELLAEGLIDNSEIADSTGGRKPRILSMVPSARFAVGAELSPHHIRMVAVDLSLRELAFHVLERPFRTDEAYAMGLAQDLELFLEENHLQRDKLLGVGLTLPGVVDADQQLLVTAPTLQISRMDLRTLTRCIPYPTFCGNDANCGGFAEWWNRTDLSSMAYLSLGRGVGGAILMGGVPYAGLHQRSGEFGHMCIHPGGHPCSCGRTGCLEAYCSTARLSDDLGVTIEAFFAGLAAGNQTYREIWETYLDNLALGVANIHTALDCDIVLGGTLSQFLGDWFGALEGRLTARDLLQEESGYLHLCRYHAASNSIGAALHFVEEFLVQV